MIAREPLTPALITELKPLLLANRDAVLIDCSPDWGELSRLDRGDAMAVVVLRVEGHAVGYVAHIANRHHLQSEIWATCVALYVDPKHSGHAWRLIREGERLARLAGAAVVTYNVPVGGKAARFLAAMRYEERELVLARRLDARPG